MKVYVNNMTCNHCKAFVEKAFSKIDGVSNVSVDLENKLAIVETNKPLSLEEFKEALEDSAYEVIRIENE